MIFGFNTDVKYGDTVYHVQSEARKHELLLQTQVFVKGRCIGKHATSYAEKTLQPDFSEEHMHEMLKEQHKHFVSAVREGRIAEELQEEEEDELKAAAAAFSEAAPIPGAAPPALAEPVATAAAAPPITVRPTAVAPILDVSSVPLDDLAEQFAAAVAEKPVDPGFVVTPAGSIIGKGISLDCLPPTLNADGNAITVCVQVSDDSGPAAGAQVSCRITSGSGPANYLYATSSAGGIADIGISLNGLDPAGTALLIQASYRGKSASRKFSLKKQA